MRFERRTRRLVMGALGMVALAACGSSGSSSPASTTAPSTLTSAGGLAPGVSTTAGSSHAPNGTADPPLRPPCTLLTKQEMASFFGTAALNAFDHPANSDGRAGCAFSLITGNQGKGISVSTLHDYANNAGYVFPSASQGKLIPNLGDQAILDRPQTSVGRITVKLGTNALEIEVEFYTDPINESLLTTLARSAIARARP